MRRQIHRRPGKTSEVSETSEVLATKVQGQGLTPFYPRSTLNIRP